MESEVSAPRNIGIIMDGNGRWAKARGLPRSAGHVRGAEVFKTITRYCESIGIEVVTVYAFSTENWKRPESEVMAIMGLLREYLADALTYENENIRIRFIGDTEPLDDEIKSLMKEIELAGENRTGMLLNIAVNYGGRNEIVRAVKKMVGAGEEPSEENLEKYLDTAGEIPVDLILRPSGEERLSNFLLWQSAYSEFVFMDVLWPDFTPADLERAIEVYKSRKRRFGGI